MRNFLVKWSKFLWKHKWLYYILMCTWNFIYLMASLIVSLVLLIFGYKPKKTPIGWKFEIKNSWGGFELGISFVRDKTSYAALDWHEMGHSFQMCLFGPFFIFIIGLPSAIRYWYRYLRYERKGKNPPTKYDDIWFEGSATEIGRELFGK